MHGFIGLFYVCFIPHKISEIFVIGANNIICHFLDCDEYIVIVIDQEQ